MRIWKSRTGFFPYNWNDYSADRVVYQPKHMSPERLQELFYDAWDTFYAEESQHMKMFKLLQNVIEREKKDNTFRPRNRNLAKQAFGRKSA